MGHCGKFDYALLDTAANLVMRYGPLQGMKTHTVKICDDFCAAGNGGQSYFKK